MTGSKVGDLPLGSSPDPDRNRAEAVRWFRDLRDRICDHIEGLEREATIGDEASPGRFARRTWKRPGQEGQDGGGGTMAILHGNLFEKIGVNVSEVHGCLAPGFAQEIPGAAEDGTFWAAGISLVAHPRSPKVPIVHMNLRHVMTRAWWFGGGIDLTPAIPFETDSREFHARLREVCERDGAGRYNAYRSWCDSYFFLPHRNEPRGIGGIFFDYRNTGNWNEDLAFVKSVGEAFLGCYSPIVRRRMSEPWTEADRERQLRKRGRYVEFNLAYDRGTRFGLMTGGNPEAVLMSLPPLAAWP